MCSVQAAINAKSLAVLESARAENLFPSTGREWSLTTDAAVSDLAVQAGLISMGWCDTISREGIYVEELRVLAEPSGCD